MAHVRFGSSSEVQACNSFPQRTDIIGRADQSEKCPGDLAPNASNVDLVTSLLANASLSEAIKDVVVLTTKLRIARTRVAHLTGPLNREVRPDCIQFGYHLLDHFQLARGSIS
jgi:hypothetical protein